MLKKQVNRVKRRLRFDVFLIGLCLLGLYSGQAQAQQIDGHAALTKTHTELLDLAYSSASTFPLVPHIKNRAQAQFWVAEAAVELGDLDRAAAISKDIPNFRRGVAFALLSHALLMQGHEQQSQVHFENARLSAAMSGLDDWERGFILAGLARVHMSRGETNDAMRLLDHEQVKRSGATELIGLTIAAQVTDVKQQLKLIESQVEDGDFSSVQIAIWTYAGLMKMYHEDEKRFAELFKDLNWAGQPVPGHVRMPAMMHVAEYVIGHGTPAQAAPLLEGLDRIILDSGLPPIYRIPARAEVVKLRFLAGDTEAADKDLASILKDYEASRQILRDYQIAQVILPIAEIYAVMGDREKSLDYYRQTIEAGVINPNIRPQLSDFTRACVSMALHGVEPDDSMWQLLRNTHHRVTNRD